MKKDQPELIGSFEKASSGLFQKATRYNLTIKEITEPFAKGNPPIEGMDPKIPPLVASIAKTMKAKIVSLNERYGQIEDLSNAKATLNKIGDGFTKDHSLIYENDTLQATEQGLLAYFDLVGPEEKELKTPLAELQKLTLTITNHGSLDDVQSLSRQLDVFSKSTWGQATNENAFITDLQKIASARVKELLT